MNYCHLHYDRFNNRYIATLMGGEFDNCHGQGPTPDYAVISLKLTVNALRNEKIRKKFEKFRKNLKKIKKNI